MGSEETLKPRKRRVKRSFLLNGDSSSSVTVVCTARQQNPNSIELGLILSFGIIGLYLFGLIRIIICLPQVASPDTWSFQFRQNLNLALVADTQHSNLHTNYYDTGSLTSSDGSDVSASRRQPQVPKAVWPVPPLEKETFEDMTHPGDKISLLKVPPFWSLPLHNDELMSRNLALKVGSCVEPDEHGNHVRGEDCPVEKRTIFVAMVSYRDFQCRSTVESIFLRARYPERIRVALVDQIVHGIDPPCNQPEAESCAQDPTSALCMYKDQIEWYEMKADLAIGPSFARHIAYRMYRGEYYATQSDAHTTYTTYWDVDIIAQHENAQNEMAVLTSHSTDVIGSVDETTGKSLRRTRPITCHVYFEGSREEGGMHLRHGLQPDTTPVVRGTPQLTPWWAAGFSFARGHFVVNVPYDPYLPMIFQGEEMSIGIRGFTVGYDYYAPERSVAFHHYAIGKNADARNRVKTYIQENLDKYDREVRRKAMARLVGIVRLDPGADPDYWDHTDEKQYGIGNARTPEQFYDSFSIDVIRKTTREDICDYVDSNAQMHKDFAPFLRSDGMGIDYNKVVPEEKTMVVIEIPNATWPVKALIPDKYEDLLHPGNKETVLKVPPFWSLPIHNDVLMSREMALKVGSCIEPDKNGNYVRGIDCPVSKRTIFVGIGSYRDWQCRYTIESIFLRARYTERIRVAVVDQIVPGVDPSCGEPIEPCHQDPTQALCMYKDQIEVYQMEAELALGPSFARHLVYRMYRGEYYATQTDAHNTYTTYWDVDIIQQHENSRNEMAVLTSHSTDIIGSIDEVTGKSLRKTRPITCHVYFEGSQEEGGMHMRHGMQPDRTPMVHGIPQLQPWWAAGFSFGRGHFLINVPYDPLLPMLFQGEEMSIGIRGFTVGYDYYAPERSVNFHHYAIGKNAEGRNKVPNYILDNSQKYDAEVRRKSMARLVGIVRMNPGGHPSYWDHTDEKQYGIGNARTPEQFYDTFGIDVFKKTQRDDMCEFVDYNAKMHHEFTQFLRDDGMGIDYKIIAQQKNVLVEIPDVKWPVPSLIADEKDTYEDLLHPGDLKTFLKVPRFWSFPIHKNGLMSRETALKIGSCIEPDEHGNFARGDACPLEKRTIFLAIASYRDFQCRYTVESIFLRARHPERIRVTVVDQIIPGEDPACDAPIEPCETHPNQALCLYRDQVEVFQMEAELSVGPVFARHIGYRMYRGEYYATQSDAHVTYVTDWDIDIIRQHESAQNEMAVLTAYLSDVQGSIDEKTGKSLRHTRPIMCNTHYEGNAKDGFYLRHATQPETSPVIHGMPQLEPWWAAGYSFSRGHFVVNVPYDYLQPMIFLGEEMSIGIRGFTVGYDFYAPARSVCFHHYAIGKNKAIRNKVKHFWENGERYPGLQQKSLNRLLGIVRMNPEIDPGIWDHIEEEHYGIGKVRTPEQFYHTFGIDVINKKTAPNLCRIVDGDAKLHRDFNRYLRNDGMGIDYSRIDYKFVGVDVPATWPVPALRSEQYENLLHSGDKKTKLKVPKFWSKPVHSDRLMTREMALKIGTCIEPDRYGSYIRGDSCPLDKRTIFIAIASYRDFQCRYTVESIFSRARHPERLRVSVVDQITPGEDPACDAPIKPCTIDPNQALCRYKEQIEVYQMEAELSIGPVFARHIGYRMYRGEYYATQSDAHVTYTTDWDVDIINQHESTRNEMAVLTAYLSDVQGSINEATGRSLRKTRPIMCNTTYEGNKVEGMYLRHAQQPDTFPQVHGTPQLEPWWAAGYSFSRGHFVVNVPYDPLQPMIFLGEEMSIGIRGFTIGYDFYAPERSVCFHHYAVGKNKNARTKVRKFTDNNEKYPGLRKKSLARLLGFVKMNPEVDSNTWDHTDDRLYGIGKVRTPDKFYKTFGIDVVKKTAEPNLCKFVNEGAKMHHDFTKFLRDDGMGIDYSRIKYKFVDPEKSVQMRGNKVL